jgi:hypothetical protein
MWYLPLPCCIMIFGGKMSYMNFGGNFLMDLLGSWSNGIQHYPHCFNGVVSYVWSILAHAGFFICTSQSY